MKESRWCSEEENVVHDETSSCTMIPAFIANQQKAFNKQALLPSVNELC